MTPCLCRDCGSTLTTEEAYYYETQCEGCVREWNRQIQLWLNGADNPEFDALFAYTPAPAN